PSARRACWSRRSTRSIRRRGSSSCCSPTWWSCWAVSATCSVRCSEASSWRPSRSPARTCSARPGRRSSTSSCSSSCWSSARPASSVSAAPRLWASEEMTALLRARRGAVVFFGLAALTPIVVRDAYFLDSLVLILLWGALSAAWNVAGGYAGQVSIGHASFFGIGAYSAALMVTRFGRGPWLGMLVGVVLSIGAGFIIGFLSNRLKGPYFALSTIAFSQVLLIG